MMKNSTFIKSLFLLLCMIAGGIGSAWADEPTGIIYFGTTSGYTNVNATSVTGNDSQGNTWTITTSGTTSFTTNQSYSQIGSSKNPASSITFTTTLSEEVNVTSINARFGGFSGTAGTVTLKVGDTTVGTGSLDATNNVTISSTSAEVGNVITVTVTNIAKGVKAFYIEYTYEAATPASPLESIALSGTYPTTFYQGDTFSHEGMTVTATYEDESTKDVTAKAEFTGYNMSDTGDQTVTVSYTEGEVTRTAEYGITISAPATLSSISLSGDYQTVFTEGDTFNHDGLVVTANYSDNTQTVVTDEAEFSIPDMSQVGEQTITVTYHEVSTTYNITINAIPTHNVIWSVNGATSSESYKEGAAINFPENPADVSGKTFVGWVTETIDGTTNEAPTFVTSATMGESDIIYYAVFAYASGSGSADVVDELNRELTEVSGTNYAGWTGKTATSTAVYAGNSAGGNNAIQLRSNNSNSGIVTTASGGKVKKVVITWDSNTTATRTVSIYGKNSAYSAASNLYSSATQGTLLGELNIDNASELTSELTINDDYEYIGIRSKSGALYLDEVQITWSTGGGVSYSDYCTTVVAAAVAKPTIEVAANPFLFSTTATITCETDGATIKYSFDGENWNNYEDALTITATTTLYAKAVKDSDESTVASVEITKNLAEPTVTVSGDLEVDLDGETDVNAGTLTAAVTYEEANVEGATVTWSSNNEAVATIDENTGAVTIKTRGTVTFTATYAGNSDYAEATGTKTVTVTDSKAPGSEAKPYTVAEARAAIDANEGVTGVYVQGVVSQAGTVNNSGQISYYISADGLTTSDQLQAYKGKGIDGADFESDDDIQVGDIVVIYGNLKKYNSIYEFDSNNQLVSLVRKVATPTFDPESGEVMAGSTVTISTTTEDATIYYTVDGTEPTAESTEYTEPITIDTDMTIKAIAVKDGMTNSNVATATYTIDLTPSIVFDGDQNPLNVSYNAYNTNVHYVASNTTGDITLVVCDEQGNAATYEWFSAEITSNVYVHVTLQANEDTENARTAYFKLVADNAESEIFAITQAKFVADYATLPFEFDGGRSDIETTSGLTQEGLGSDYTSSPKLKFDSTDDYVILKINERPGILTFDIKGNTFSGGTFTVQTSADGEAYTDLETYTNLGNTQSEEFDNLDENVRYIKWIYTNKNSGNVALGNITMAKYETPSADPEITVTPAEVNVDAAEHDGTLDLTYANLTISDMDDFVIQYYDGEGEETSEPDWIEVVVAEQDPQIGEGYVVSFYTIENEGEARTAYFKVYAMVDETNLVYSNLVTVTQAAYVAPGVTDNYALFTGELIEGDYIIYYDGYAMKNTVESDRLSYEEMTPVNDVITTDNAAIVWHIAKSGDYWTIYNAEADAYAASTGAKNKAQMLADGTDDKALWTVSRYGDAYEFVNKKNSDANVNAYLRNNSTFGFACYASTTGGDLTLYKKVIPVTGEATITLNAACTDGEFVYGTYSNASAFVVPSDLTVSEIAIIDGTLLVEEYSTGAVVPANTGVMVAATAGGDYTVDLTSDAGKSVLGDDNRLRATGAGISAEEMGADTDCVFYRLTMHNGSDLGFWWGAENGAAFTIAANKAYLAVPKTVGARIQGFSFDDGIVTGIANMNREAMINNGSVYNMKGQRVAQPAKGLYIQNGKKVVVK